MISLVINTNCLGDNTKGLSSGGQPYGNREYILRNFILLAATRQGLQVIVAGEFEEGEGYTYVKAKGPYNNCADALVQRQAGFEACDGDIIIFQHDDHIFSDYNDLSNMYGLPLTLKNGTDVISPSRRTRLRGRDEELNSGGNKYILGHAAIYRREVIKLCPWSQVPPVFTWDIEHTKQIKERGFNIIWSKGYNVYDVEYGSEPWQ